MKGVPLQVPASFREFGDVIADLQRLIPHREVDVAILNHAYQWDSGPPVSSMCSVGPLPRLTEAVEPRVTRLGAPSGWLGLVERVQRTSMWVVWMTPWVSSLENRNERPSSSVPLPTICNLAW